MIRLEHINIVVKNMQETLAFYRAAFPHWWVREQGNSDWYGVNRNWLHFGDDYSYLTLNDNGQRQNRDLTSNDIGLAHIGFEVSNLQDVKSRMQLAGFKPSHFGAVNPHRINIYYIDPNGYEVEFVEYNSDIPQQRNNSDDVALTE